MRRLRHFIDPALGNQAAVEITARTASGHFLLKPDEEVNALLAGVLARAKAHTGTEIYAPAHASVPLCPCASVPLCLCASAPLRLWQTLA